MTTLRYLDAADFVALASMVLDVEPDGLLAVIDIGLLDSALHAPQAGFGEVEFYPALHQKAAVLYAHLARNHCLGMDGNKRAAFAAMQLFLNLNGQTLVADPDEAGDVLEDVAASAMDMEDFIGWVEEHLVARHGD